MKKFLNILSLLMVGVSFGTTYTVTNLNDSGTGSLREAINSANGNPGADLIQFNVSGTINLNSQLPYIYQEIYVDGFSAPGYTVGDPQVLLQMNNTNTDFFYLGSGSEGSTIRGLSFINGSACVVLDGVSGCTVAGNWVGLNSNGTPRTTLLPHTGFKMRNGATGNTIGGTTEGNRNVICSVTEHGVRLESGAHTNTISGNYIGVAVDGVTAGQSKTGIIMDDSDDNIIGGSVWGARNVICSAADDGIRVDNNSDGTIIRGNFIGIGADGSTPLGNGLHGVLFIEGSDNGIVGGSLLPERNFAGDNERNGFSVNKSGGIQFINNYSGVDSSGMSAVANGWSGLSFERADNCVADGNLFSGNDHEGIWMGPEWNTTNFSHDLTFTNNVIGTDKTGLAPLPNAYQGIMVTTTSRNITIGSPGNGNLVSGNMEEGIRIDGATAVVESNWVGVDSTGLAAMANGRRTANRSGSDYPYHGVEIDNGSAVTIGGDTQAKGNVISGNTRNGVIVEATDAVTLRNNIIGLDINGVNAVPNEAHGVQFLTSSNNQLLDNKISGNLSSGALFMNVDNSTVQRNEFSSNGANGLALLSGSAGNDLSDNTFIANGTNGVFIQDQNSQQNLISEGSFSCNGTRAINLNGTDAQGVGNDLKKTPTINFNSPIGRLNGLADPNDVIEVYTKGDCDTLGTCDGSQKMQGKTYITSVNADGSGYWEYASTMTSNQYTVTGTDSDDNTSEFAICGCSDPTFEVAGVDATNCEGSDGQLEITGIGDNPIGAGVEYQVTFIGPGGTVGPVTMEADADGVLRIPDLPAGTYTSVTIGVLTCSTTETGSFVIGGDPFAPGSLIVGVNSLCSYDDLNLLLSGGNGTTVTWMDSTASGTWAAITGALAVGSSSTDVDVHATNSPIYFRGFVEDAKGCSGYTNVELVTVDSCCQDPTFDVAANDPTNCEATNGGLVITGSGATPIIPGVTYNVSYFFGGGTVNYGAVVADGSAQLTLTDLDPGSYTDIAVGYETCSTTENASFDINGVPFEAGTLSVSSSTICSFDSVILSLNGGTGSTVIWMDSSSAAGWTNISSALATASADFEANPYAANSPVSFRGYVEDGACNGFTNELAVTVDSCCQDPSFDVTTTDATNCEATNGQLIITGSGATPIIPGITYFITYFDGTTNQGPVDLVADDSATLTIEDLGPGTYTDINVGYETCNTLEDADFAVGGEAFDPGTLNVSAQFICDADSVILFLSGGNGTQVTWYDSTDGGTLTDISGVLATNNANFEAEPDAINPSVYYVGLVEDAKGCSGYTNVEEVLVDSCCVDPTFDVVVTDADNCAATDGQLVLNGSGASPIATGVTYYVSYVFEGQAVDSLELTGDASQQLIIGDLLPGTYTDINVAYATCNTLNDTDFTIGGSAFDPGILLVSDQTICNIDSVILSLSNTNGATVTWMDSSGVGGDWNNISAALDVNDADFVDEPYSSRSPIFYRGYVEDGACNGFTNIRKVDVDSCCNNPTFAVEANPATNCEATNGSLSLSGSGPFPLIAGGLYYLSYDFNGERVDSFLVTADTNGQIIINDLDPGVYGDVEVEVWTCESTIRDEFTIEGTPFDPGTMVIASDTICSYDQVALSLENSTGTTVRWMDSSSMVGDAWEAVSGALDVNAADFDADAYAAHGPVTFVGFVERGACQGYTNEISVQVDSCCVDPTFDVTLSHTSNCEATDGMLVFTGSGSAPLIAGQSYTVTYDHNGVTVAELTTVADTNLQITLTGLTPGIYDNINIAYESCNTLDSASYDLEGVPFNAGTLGLSASTICSVDSVDLTLSNTTGTTVVWEGITTVASGYETLSDTMDASNADYSVLFEAEDSTVTIRGYVEDDKGCAGYTNEASLTVDSCCVDPTYDVAGFDPENCEANDGRLVFTGSGAAPIIAGAFYTVNYTTAGGTSASEGVVANDDLELIVGGLTPGDYIELSVDYQLCSTDYEDTVSLEGEAFNPGTLVVHSTSICNLDSLVIDLEGGNGNFVTWMETIEETETWDDISGELPTDDAIYLAEHDSGTTMITYRGLVTTDECEGFTNEVAVTILPCLPDPELFVPDAVSPNNDNSFDTWVIQDIDRFEEFNIKVYNRWGNLVYETNAPYEPWDGTRNGEMLPMGTYYYVIDIEEFDETLSGPLTILR